MTTILMTQALQRQGEIWHNVLSSQNLTVIWENLDADILVVLEGMETAGLALSQLLLLDMGMMVTNPYRFCQVAQSRFPAIPVVIRAGHDRQIRAADTAPTPKGEDDGQHRRRYRSSSY
ncbi:hypothetical protein RHP47_10005 [Thermosynechococcus sp. QKsg1]|uniref:hypothetical protein n=1 Tax=unclassified Thermosynechococcus TaxID=2622553 RepID=UPI002673B86F|nr:MULTISPECIES: hypothetical protein [unclassified Thermosynechococcus]WKT83166.1 hypothetical protein QYC28_10110 [Thermosynechococcus sp. HY596]WNC62295.1 hypothetical protein RHK13_10105 [Thermosynechococcus sp. HY591]WNC64850.1 hypothetical protein RHK28_10140 [Thermosynechococcus sp. HY593]WNC86171.1 hypothetical protein RHP47_10005 [Thermosynechococcus sp. QKsg1]